MQEVYQINWKNSKKTAVAMGYFDGIHIGHKFLIDQMKQYAEVNNLDKAVFTFTKNITLGHKGKDILTVRQKVIDITVVGRSGMGVRLVRLTEGAKLVSLSVVDAEDSDVPAAAPQQEQESSGSEEETPPLTEE
jgi:nicotinic acid mononucleotide adenylyltransferase